MERSGLMRWLFIGLTVFLVVTLVPKLFGNGEAKHQPLKAESAELPKERKPEKVCDLYGPRFRARISSQGASLKNFELTTAKYRREGEPTDLSTTPGVELRRQLHFRFRNDAVEVKKEQGQVDYDLYDFDLVQADGKSCVFEYSDDQVKLTRTIRTTERPYELEVSARIENLADAPKKHAASVETVAWRRDAEVAGGMFRVSPFITHVECVTEDGTITRLRPEDFEPEDFEGEGFTGTLNPGDWHQSAGKVAVAAVSNAYFSHALAPIAADKAGAPVCQLQIEERWNSAQFDEKKKDPNAGAMYRARLAYPPVELAPKEGAEYKVLTYIGPKERDLLAAAGGGEHDLSELIDLGFFSAIAKVLVAFLLKVYSVIPNWGIAIIVLTVVARTLLFPLSVPSIKSMIKMRELKPELDALNAKFKDDPQQRGLAQMELWRKHKVNPLKGCLPQLASMPVWFALYTTLQTAVELYNIPFLWFPDLSEPDPFYILPFVIGGTSFLQQKLIPMQGDATQQKMMLYMMPAMFTVFMLFLPAGLGVYMFTNGVLGIVQQQIVEQYVKRTNAKSAAAEKQTDESAESTRGPEGKRSKKSRGSGKKGVDGGAELSKGKA